MALALGGFILQAAEAGALRGVPVLGALAPWRAGLVVLGLLGAPVALLTATVVEPKRRHRLAGATGAPPSLAQAVSALLSLWRPLAPLYAAMGLANICDFAILNWTPTLLIRRFGLGVGEIGGVLGGAVIVAGVLGSFGAGLLADRLVRRGGRPARLRLSVAAMAVGIFATLLVVAPAPSVVFLMAAIWICASTTGQSLGLTLLAELAPGDARGLSVSLASLINIGIGLAAGAAAPALIMDHVLHDPTKVGAAVTLAALPCALASTLLYRVSLGALRRMPQA
jgi:predicted MFS family arabinose efflux permease